MSWRPPTIAEKWAQYARVLEVRENRQLAPERLRELATDPAAAVRRHVSWHPNTPADVIDQLLEDLDEHVLCGALRHPNATSVALRWTAAALGDGASQWRLRTVAEHRRRTARRTICLPSHRPLTWMAVPVSATEDVRYAWRGPRLRFAAAVRAPHRAGRLPAVFDSGRGATRVAARHPRWWPNPDAPPADGVEQTA